MFSATTVHIARLKTWLYQVGRTLSEVCRIDGVRKALLVMSSSSACARVAVLVASGIVWRRVWGLKMSPEAIVALVEYVTRKVFVYIMDWGFTL